jgi:hypothetical protein
MDLRTHALASTAISSGNTAAFSLLPSTRCTGPGRTQPSWLHSETDPISNRCRREPSGCNAATYLDKAIEQLTEDVFYVAMFAHCGRPQCRGSLRVTR